MLAFHNLAIRAGGNRALSSPLRYLAQRWAELVDEQSHFSRSASALVDPITVVRDFFSAGQEFLESPDFRFPSMLEAFQTTRASLTLERNLHGWFRSERDGAIKALKRVEPVRGIDQVARRRHVVRRTRGALQGELLTLRNALEDPKHGYRQRLLDAICESGPQSEKEWRAFDENLAYLAASVLSQGRGQRRIALDLARVFAEASADEEAIVAFRTLVDPTLERHTVALVLTGLRSLHRDAVAYGCSAVPDPPAWLPPSRARDNERLVSFVRTYGGPTSCPVFVDVDALDANHARRVAFERAEELQDQLAAEHRIGRFSVKREALVRGPGGRIDLIQDDLVIVERARPRIPTGLPELERSLRFHRLACNSDSPVLGVAQSWIALEHLARGATRLDPPRRNRPARRTEVKPAVFLPAHVASLAFLAGARHLVISCWHVARKGCRPVAQQRWVRLERWLNVSQQGRIVDEDRWLALLKASPSAQVPHRLHPQASAEDASALFWRIVDMASPFVQQRLHDAAELVREPSRLSFFAARAERRAWVNVARIHLMRHRTVHGALMHDESAYQLAAAAHHLLDAVYEVLPNWLAGTTAPWEGFDQAQAWSEELKREWDRRGAELDAPITAIVSGRNRP
jgi:hypothetical protein